MDKEKKILKAIREKQQIIYFKGKTTLMAADFSLKIMEVRGCGTDIKVFKEANYQPRILHLLSENIFTE